MIFVAEMVIIRRKRIGLCPNALLQLISVAITQKTRILGARHAVPGVSRVVDGALSPATGAFYRSTDGLSQANLALFLQTK